MKRGNDEAIDVGKEKTAAGTTILLFKKKAMSACVHKNVIKTRIRIII